MKNVAKSLSRAKMSLPASSSELSSDDEDCFLSSAPVINKSSHFNRRSTQSFIPLPITKRSLTLPVPTATSSIFSIDGNRKCDRGVLEAGTVTTKKAMPGLIRLYASSTKSNETNMAMGNGGLVRGSLKRRLPVTTTNASSQTQKVSVRFQATKSTQTECTPLTTTSNSNASSIPIAIGRHPKRFTRSMLPVPIARRKATVQPSAVVSVVTMPSATAVTGKHTPSAPPISRQSKRLAEPMLLSPRAKIQRHEPLIQSSLSSHTVESHDSMLDTSCELSSLDASKMSVVAAKEKSPVAAAAIRHTPYPHRGVRIYKQFAHQKLSVKLQQATPSQQQQATTSVDSNIRIMHASPTTQADYRSSIIDRNLNVTIRKNKNH